MTAKRRLTILTEDSVDKLRAVAQSGSLDRLWNEDLPTLTESYGLVYFDSSLLIDGDWDLTLPSKAGGVLQSDFLNAGAMVRVLPTLTAADAVDERLWVTLALGPFRDYVLDRWPTGTSGLGNHLHNHIFASTGRRRERDHAIARLWWMGHYVRRVAGDDFDGALQAFFINSDLPVQLLGRPNLATVGPIARNALKVFRKYFVEEGVRYDRDGVRNFLEGIDFIAGRSALGALGHDELAQSIEERFRYNMKLSIEKS